MVWDGMGIIGDNDNMRCYDWWNEFSLNNINNNNNNKEK